MALLPFLKYPANPPGVGDPATLHLRQQLYFGLMAAAAVGLGVALVAWARLRRTLGHRAGPVATLGYAAFCLALALVLPANPDPTPVPPELLLAFRLRSALGLLAYWGAFALLFALLIRRASRAAAARAPGWRVSPSGPHLSARP